MLYSSKTQNEGSRTYTTNPRKIREATRQVATPMFVRLRAVNSCRLVNACSRNIYTRVIRKDFCFTRI